MYASEFGFVVRLEREDDVLWEDNFFFPEALDANSSSLLVEVRKLGAYNITRISAARIKVVSEENSWLTIRSKCGQSLPSGFHRSEVY